MWLQTRMFLLIALMSGIFYELKQIDKDMNGTIGYDELVDLRQKQVKLTSGDKFLELFTTHPNMLKRIKHLSSLTV